MTKIFDQAMAGERDHEQDQALMRRMKLLEFIITPEVRKLQIQAGVRYLVLMVLLACHQTLEVNPNVQNDVVWSIAQDELRRIRDFKAPGDKVRNSS